MTTQQQISNKVFLSQIDGALKHEDIPRVKLNKLIDMAHARLTCDDECQKKEKIKQLKKKWLDSKKLSTNLPDEITKNEKAYYDLAMGKAYYKDNVERPIYINKFNQFDKLEKDKLTGVKTVLSTLLDSYKGESIALIRMTQLYDDLLKKNKALKNDVQDYYKKTMTAERKVYYEDNEIDNLHYYNTLLKVIYYVVLVLYIFAKFFSNEHHKNIWVWLYIIFYIILPWILKYIVGYFYEM